jgi:GDPmannose 4,6-dehydratase
LPLWKRDLISYYPVEGLIMSGKKALICGISGQDGTYLAKFLLDRGYVVCGTSRDAQISTFRGLETLGIRSRVQLESMAPNDFRSVLQVMARFQPDEVYNLAGQSSVGLSFQQPVETLESIAVGTLNLLEVVRFMGGGPRVYNATSTECFGDVSSAADEDTPFRPRSPYAVAKATAFWEVSNYREAYGLFACSGILSNHDSPLRPHRFVTRKLVSAAVKISRGHTEPLLLGDISIQRDWGWAPEYVEAMWMMLQTATPSDYLIATGETHSLEEFVSAAFAAVDLDWRKYVQYDETLRRPTDLRVSRTNPSRARDVLGWSARFRMHDVVRKMVDAERSDQSQSP